MNLRNLILHPSSFGRTGSPDRAGGQVAGDGRGERGGGVPLPYAGDGAPVRPGQANRVGRSECDPRSSSGLFSSLGRGGRTPFERARAGDVAGAAGGGTR